MVKVLKNKRAKGNGMKMKYNFDEVIDRYDTNSVKYENAKEEEPDLKDDFIPLWIADMDFACPPEVIKEYGVLNPCIVRPREDGGYEIISGHRRKYACQLAGKAKIPAIIRNYTDDEATIIMVDSNIQREHILPSEKAHAYAMKYEALKHQGVKGRKNTADMVGEMAGDSSRTVQRYIRLSKLVPGLLKYVDNGELQVASAEQLAGLPEEEQKIVLDVIEYLVIFPNRQLATKIKELSQAGNLKRETLYEIFAQRNETRVNVTIPSKRIKNYFPEEYTKEQMESVIYELLEEWSHKKGIVQ